MGSTNSKPPALIIMIGYSKLGRRSQIIFITVFSSRCTALLRFLRASADWANLQEKNQFPELNPYMFTFLHPILMCRVTQGAPVGILFIMNNWRMRYVRLGIRECGVHITKHFKKFTSEFRLWEARRQFISIHSPPRRGRGIVPIH